MKLYNTAKSLILEIAAVDSIVDAIKKKQVIVIYYDGDEPGGRGLQCQKLLLTQLLTKHQKLI